MSRFGQSIEVNLERRADCLSNVSIRIRRRALDALRERQMPLIRVEPRINSSLGAEFVRFLFYFWGIMLCTIVILTDFMVLGIQKLKYRSIYMPILPVLN